MRKYLSERWFRWATAIAVLTIIFGTIYIVAQQSIRISANDPQIQMVEDISAQINKGADPTQFTNFPIDISNDLVPFVIIYDKSGKVLASSANLNGFTPELPKGVLDHARPQNKVTWEPQDGVRIAAVVQTNNKGYVLAGRSLREVEKSEDHVLQLSALGWLISVIFLFVSWTVRTKFVDKNGTDKKHKK